MSELPEEKDPPSRARERWRRHAVEEYGNPQNLTLSQAGDYARLNPKAIRAREIANQLYALPDPTRTGKWRYPQWQFDAQPLRLACILQMFSQTNRWVLHSFMVNRRNMLNGKSPTEAILDESTDIQRVVTLAQMILTGEQGAT
ncbi:hypothetical protein BCAR13_410048 [Paraburkholderia caribensis]|uniref:hypothetical protein n=1 Tax=Paraburkholderia caribensis TaxID=75105 RepID=UPI001CAF1246|nr:hypothetical protein [Paraburkholderia caribensis]CAG9219335.1 hypothetical protein BCAR13_410048 [Paraburkholderia caribensis]